MTVTDRPSFAAAHGSACTLLAVLSIGCTGPQRIDPLRLVGLGGVPIRIGVTEQELSPPLMLPKRTLFEQSLEFRLNEPVSFELMSPRQIRVHLSTGRLSFAILTAADYAEIAPAHNCIALAVPLNQHGSTSRRGLIIVAASSPLQSPAQLCGRPFHGLPQPDLLNEAALGVLFEAGVPSDEINKGSPRPELDIYHAGSLEVAQCVMHNEESAGVIDEADYKTWKPTGGGNPFEPSQDQLRIIARTAPVPEGPFVASMNTPLELMQKVNDYLFKELANQPQILASMGCRGFAPPIDPAVYEPFFAICRRLHPPCETQPDAQLTERVQPH